MTDNTVYTVVSDNDRPGTANSNGFFEKNAVLPNNPGASIDNTTYAVDDIVNGNGSGNGTGSFYEKNTIYESLLLDSASNAGTTLPLMDATFAAIGVATKWARQDHVHPTDTTRAPLVSPNFTGTVGLEALLGEQGGDYGDSGSTDFSYNSILVDSDGHQVTGGNRSTHALYVQLAVDQTSGRGQKYAFRGLTTSFFNGDVGGDLVGVSGWALSPANQGGTDTGTGAIGTLYGMEASGHAFPGATNYFVVSGGEANAWIDVGASASHRWGWSISGIGYVRGALSDAGINVGASMLSWNTGLQFASYNGLAPVTTTGSVLGSDGSAFTVANWAKFPAVNITGNIFEFQNYEVAHDGKVKIGYNADLNIFGAPSMVQSVSDDAPWGSMIACFSNNANESSFNFLKSRATAAGSHATVVNGDHLGSVFVFADDGTTYDNVAAQLYAYVDGPVTAGNVPGAWAFATSPFFNATPRLTIGSTGIVSVLSNIASTSTTTGAFQVAGGAGIVGDLHVGGTVSAGVDGFFLGSTTWAAEYFFSPAYYRALRDKQGTERLSIGDAGDKSNYYVADVHSFSSFNYGASLAQLDATSLALLQTTASTSPITGALKVAGGAGIAGALNVGGAASAATAAVDTNTTQLATTAYFFGQAGAANPLAAGTAAPGTSSRWSRQDHVHPTDTTRAPTASPTFTGTVTAAAISATGAVKSSGGALGYATGAGGTVTQATSKATGVTLSKFSGAITLNAAALASGAIVSFVMTNTNIAATDVLVLNHISGGTIGPYLLNAQCAAGSATINVRNTSAASLSEAIVIQFALVKAVNA